MISKATEKLNSWIVSSQKRIFASELPTESLESLRGFKNEAISFCIAYRAESERAENGRDTDLPISVSVTSPQMPISVYKILSTPYPAYLCEDAESGALGGCPDILLPRQSATEILRNERDKVLPFCELGERALLCASCVTTQGLYVEINRHGDEIPAGKHELRIEITSLKSGNILGTHILTVDIADALLPKNELIYTNWIHYDCLADVSGLTPWSDEYFALLGKYVRTATENGMNTLLTPAFTPALDTPIGTERACVQLVGVKRINGEYVFDLSLLRRFMTLAIDMGIEVFEHCHLFSQWGARTAINIYGEDEGGYTRLFGWDTPATDPEYARFLREYLKEFLSLADELGVGDKLLFHISDEPADEHRADYAAAIDTVRDVLAGKKTGDALSHYSFYEYGLTQLPIVDVIAADDFDGRCDGLMLYYTGGERPAGLTNRLLTGSPWKTRILGLQLYRYNAQGFLHWGYNYYYGRMSQGLFDPATDPCFYKNLPGVTYLVYTDTDKAPLSSLREKQMRDAITDHRALRLCESLVGRARTLEICEEVMGEPISVYTLPRDGAEMLLLRERIDTEIRKALEK